MDYGDACFLYRGNCVYGLASRISIWGLVLPVAAGGRG